MHIHIRSKGKSMSKYSEIPAHSILMTAEQTNKQFSKEAQLIFLHLVRTLVADSVLHVGFNKAPYKTDKQPGLLSLCKIHI